MKILILSLNYAPEMIGTAVYSHGMADYLASKGHTISVLTSHPYYPAWKVFDGWPRRRFVHTKTNEGLGPTVTYCPVYVPKSPTAAKRIAHYLSFTLSSSLSAIRKAVSKDKPNVVVVVAPSLISALTGILISKLSGARSWLHIQDFEVEATFATGLLKPNSSIGRIALAFEFWALKRFDRVSTISSAMLAKLHEKGVPAGRVRELRNWADLDLISSGPVDAKMRAMLGITTLHVVLYSGNLANKQGLEILPEVARRLAHRDDITMLICGDGPMRNPLHQACKDLPNVRFAALQPKERLGALLRAADLHLLPQIAGAADLVLPSKLKNMLASGRPIVVTANAGTALALEVGNAGIVTPPGDAMAFAKAICELVDDPIRRIVMGQDGQECAQTRWNSNTILAEFEGQLRDLMTSVPTHPRVAVAEGEAN